ncbi:MAG: hypothetical protein KGL39_40830 [Patescibacteria group bacterium]|nr:hypothetical protein [Patescibacteria group bacterium]
MIDAPRFLASAPAVIDALGGNRRLAALCGVVPEAVSLWRCRGRFPAARFARLATLARQHGVVIDEALFRFERKAYTRKTGEENP